MADGFRFELETLEKLRKRERDVQRRLVADAAARVTVVERRITALLDEVRDARTDARDFSMAGVLKVEQLRQTRSHVVGLEVEIGRQRATLDERCRELEERRVELLKASQRLKVIEKLRERRYARFQERLACDERNTMDETAIQQFLRKQERMELTDIR